MIMTYFSARRLHRRLLDSLYFASKFLQVTTLCPQNARQIKVKELLALLNNFNVVCFEQFYEKRLTVKSRDDRSDLVKGQISKP